MYENATLASVKYFAEETALCIINYNLICYRFLLIFDLNSLIKSEYTVIRDIKSWWKLWYFCKN